MYFNSIHFDSIDFHQKVPVLEVPSDVFAFLSHTHVPEILATRNTSYLTASKSLNDRQIARMAPILTIFGPNRSRPRDIFFEKKSNERRRHIVASSSSSSPSSSPSSPSSLSSGDLG